MFFYIKTIAKKLKVNDISDPSLRVIADHLRSSSFLLSDGVIIGSSLVQMIEQGSEKKEFDRIGKYISEIKKAIS